MVFSVAPIIYRIGSVKSNNMTVKISPIPIAAYTQKLDIFFARSLFPSPKALEITEQPPMPIKVPMVIIKEKIGAASDTAATIIINPAAPISWKLFSMKMMAGTLTGFAL